MAFAHVAMRRDAPCGTKGLAFPELVAHLRNGSAYLESCSERLDAVSTERVEFFAPQRDQFIFFVHLRRANVKRSQKMNSLMFDEFVLRMTNILGLPTNYRE